MSQAAPTGVHREWLSVVGGSVRGVTSIEYALIAMLIAVAILGSVKATGSNLSNLYEKIVETLPF